MHIIVFWWQKQTSRPSIKLGKSVSNKRDSFGLPGNGSLAAKPEVARDNMVTWNFHQQIWQAAITTDNRKA